MTDETPASPDPATAFSQEPRFYGRRKGKPLRAGRQALMEQVMPRLAIPPGPPTAMLDPRGLFPGRPTRLWLEIGFGGGEHLTAQAAAHPEVGLIGSEVFEYGLGKAVSQIDALGLANVRLWPEDARLLIPRLPDRCLERVFVLFPDPWPKRRHARRRLIQQDSLSALARLLVDGGELRIASDDPTYQTWALMQTTAHPDYSWTARCAADWQTRPQDWVETRYEAKALAAGRSPIYLIFSRRSRVDKADDDRP